MFQVIKVVARRIDRAVVSARASMFGGISRNALAFGLVLSAVFMALLSSKASAAEGEFTIQTLTGFTPTIIGSVVGAALVGIFIIMYGWKTAFRLAVKTWRGVVGGR